MRIRRGLLFWGLFLIPLGGLPLLARAGAVDPALMADAWRLWPLVLVALGLAVLLGRNKAGLIGVAATALVLGSLAGGSLASGGRWIGGFGDCSLSASDMNVIDESGTFGADAALAIDLPCGTAHVTVLPGSAWTAHADYRGDPPPIVASHDRLGVGATDGGDGHRQDWTITVGAAALRSIDLQANAGSGTMDLAGATLTSLNADVNAADLLIDGGAATIGRLDVSANAGRVRITLGAAATTGAISANAGAIDLCVPPAASLRIQAEDQLTFAQNLDSRGLRRSGDTWTRAGTGDLIGLTIQGNAASFTLDPAGGCK